VVGPGPGHFHRCPGYLGIPVVEIAAREKQVLSLWRQILPTRCPHITAEKVARILQVVINSRQLSGKQDAPFHDFFPPSRNRIQRQKGLANLITYPAAGAGVSYLYEVIVYGKTLLPNVDGKNQAAKSGM
jgi:hypothetical protein